MASLIGGAIGGVGSLLGGIFGSNAASKAGQVLNQAGQTVAGNIGQAVNTANTGVAGETGQGQQQVAGGITAGDSTLQNVFQGQTNNLNPYLQAGVQGTQQLTAAMAPGGSLSGQFTAPTAAQAAATPGEQFIMQQGTAALNRSAAASGLSQSGGQLKALTQYGQNLASTYYQQAYNNAQSTYQMNRQNTLQGIGALTNLGQFGTQQYNTAAGQFGSQTNQNQVQGNEAVANLGMQGQNLISGNTMQGTEAAGQALMQGAQGEASGIMGQANAWSGAMSGIGSAVDGGLTAYSNQQAYGGGMGSGQGGGYLSNPSTSYTNGPNTYNPSNPNNSLWTPNGQ